MDRDRPAAGYMSIGNVLVRQRKLTEEQLARALSEQRRLGGGEGRNPLLGTILVKLKLCSPGDLRNALAVQERSQTPTLDRTAEAQDRLDVALESMHETVADLSEVTRSKTQEVKVADLQRQLTLAHG